MKPNTHKYGIGQAKRLTKDWLHKKLRREDGESVKSDLANKSKFRQGTESLTHYEIRRL